jgi:hypothetical protein
MIAFLVDGPADGRILAVQGAGSLRFPVRQKFTLVDRLLGANERALAFLQIAQDSQKNAFELLAALDAFKVATAWPRPGLKPTEKRWEASQLLARRAEYCVLAFLRSVSEMFGAPAHPTGIFGTPPPGGNVALDRLEEVIQAEADRHPEQVAKMQEALDRIRVLTGMRRGADGKPPGNPGTN